MAQIDQSAVAEFPIFAGLSAADLGDLLREARVTSYPRGADVFRQDDDAHSFFVLLEGHLRVVKLTPDGRQIVVRYVSPGEIFGVAMAIGRGIYPGTATAAVDSRALVWPTAAWPRLIAKYPSLTAQTMQTVGSRLQESHEQLIALSTEQVEQRVARALLRLAQQAGRKVAEGIQIDFPISRQDVAEMTGTTLHTVSRILSAWETQGLVESGRQRITITAPHRLLLLAEQQKD